MMDAFREAAGPEANLQTLARGTNVVGLESQSSDIVKLHAQLFKKHGITTIRNFDALNDVNNLIYSGQCIVDAGLKHQVCVTLMELPPGCSGAHDADFYEATLQNILDAGIPFDAVCFKDASGTAVPSKVYETISRARKILPSEAFIHFHTHETAGSVCWPTKRHSMLVPMQLTAQWPRVREEPASRIFWQCGTRFEVPNTTSISISKKYEKQKKLRSIEFENVGNAQ